MFKQRIFLIGLLIWVVAVAYGQKEGMDSNRSREAALFREKTREGIFYGRIDKQGAIYHRIGYGEQKSLFKSGRILKQRLDSVIKVVWNNNTSQYENAEKVTMTYDANGNSTVYQDEQFDVSTGEINFGWKYELTYDANGYRIMYVHYTWNNNTDQFICDWKVDYTNDSVGNIVQFLESAWNRNTNQWIISYKREYTYDTNGNRTLDVLYVPADSTGPWLPYSKIEYRFDSAGQSRLNLGYQWDEFSQQWATDYIEEYIYTDTVVQFKRYCWIANASRWDTNYISDRIYNSSGKLLRLLYYAWDVNTCQFVVDETNDYTYDNYENMVFFQHKYWDMSTGQCYAIDEECTYDNTYAYDDLIIPPLYDPIYYNHELTLRLFYVDDQVYSKYINYYSEQNINSIAEAGSEFAKLYPNPVTDYITFNFVGISDKAVFELYDIFGRRLMSEDVSSKGGISLERISSGLYLYTVYADGKKQSGRLVKE